MPTSVEPPVQPVFSHGGGSGVSGATTGAGKAIAIYRAAGLNWPAMVLITTGAMTVTTEVNPGPLLASGVPDPDNWIELSETVFAAAGTNPGIAISPAYPYVRTKITAWTDGALKSLVPCIPLPTGEMVSAQYPTLKAGGNQ